MKKTIISGSLVISLLTVSGCSVGDGGLFSGWFGGSGAAAKPKLIEIPQLEAGRAATSSELGAAGEQAAAGTGEEAVLGLTLGVSRDAAEEQLVNRGFIHENGEIWTRSEDRAMLAFGPNGLARIRLFNRYATRKMAISALSDACPVPVKNKADCQTETDGNVYEARIENPDGVGWLLVEELRDRGASAF